MLMEKVWGNRMAFVVIDMQRKYWVDRPDWDEVLERTVSVINHIADDFRAHGLPVIFVRFPGKTCRGDDPPDGDEFHHGLNVLDSDIIMDKPTMNAFNKTDLEGIVRGNECDTVLISGCVSQYCVISTYYSAFDHDIVSYIAEGSTIGTTEEMEKGLETLAKTLSVERIHRRLEELSAKERGDITGR
ncbi:MAG: cysteine hydrolase [Candidatus Methanomethylophilaceae archaeon]|nr:cysteine hydrolase [Candidatus Methanomethylophilaceae archaeon]